MKKVLSLSLILCSMVALTGCGKDSISKNEETFKEFAIDHYNTYLKGTEGLKEVEISLEKLKDANERAGANYDIAKLSSCTDDSYVTLKINQTNNEVESVAYNLNCAE